jgi:NTE family protein
MTRQGTPIIKRKLNIALQGGGSHSAYAWGVLDRLLEEKDIKLLGVGGASASAMNAANVESS